MTHEVFKQNLIKPSRVLSLTPGYEAIESYVSEFTSEFAELHTGIKSDVIKGLVKEISEHPKGMIYGRMGVSVQEFGLLSQYLIMLLNLLLGKIDEEGGMMFPSPGLLMAVPASGPGYFAKRRSRVQGFTRL